MFLHIDPTIPLVWRNHNSAQAGIDPVRVRFDDVDDTMARALAELVRGTSTQRLSGLLGAERSAQLRETIGPLLVPRHAPLLPRVAVIGDTSATTDIATLCSPAWAECIVARHSTDVNPDSVDVIVLVGDFVISPMDVQPWLGSDINHITIVFTESAATVGPLVRPGESACVSCVELERIDVDPAWSAIAPQVWTRRAHPSRALVAHSASELLAVMTAGSGYSTRIDGDTLSRVIRPHAIHPRCGCHSLPELPARSD